jgi:hypothetical protein
MELDAWLVPFRGIPKEGAQGPPPRLVAGTEPPISGRR